MTVQKSNPIFIYRSYVNSFHYLYQDASYLHNLAKNPPAAGTFQQVQLSRTALILYVFSLEALINLVWVTFLPDETQSFFRQREDRLSIEDKWLLLPLILSQGTSTLDRSRYPWSHFSELVRIRNDYVHPKHDREIFIRAITSHRVEPLDKKDIPQDSGLTEADLVYRQTMVPRDPYAVLPNHVDSVKRVVDDMVKELDRVLGGQVTKDNWCHKDTWALTYPPGATMADLPPDPNPPKPRGT